MARQGIDLLRIASNDNPPATHDNLWNQTGTLIWSDNAGADRQLYPTTGKVSTANVTNPPTDAELDSAFGTPAAVGAGFIGVLNDAAGDTSVYFVFSTGTSWFYVAGTKAT